MNTDDFRDLGEAFRRMATHADKAAEGNEESKTILLGFFRRFINDRRIMTENGLVDLAEFVETDRL